MIGHKTLILPIIAPFLLLVAGPASAETRRCNASLGWETTGGSLRGAIDSFKGVGECGSPAVANRCRTRAREAVERCVQTQWERRWEHHPINSDGTPSPGFDRSPPEACLLAANIEGYSLKKDCWTERKDGANARNICHNAQAHSSNIREEDIITVSTGGDIKSALETEVCCFFENGTHEFSNNEEVHVRLIAQASSGNDPQKKCNMRRVLSDDYKINCTRVRQSVCRR
jgi:hypothetical protein